MRAAFCSSPTCKGPGPLRGTRLCITTSLNQARFLLSAPLRSLPKGNTWPSICNSAPKTSPGWRLRPSCNICLGICGGRSCCCGIGALSTNARRSQTICATTPESIWSISLPMPPSLIRPSTSGIKLIGPYAIRPLKTWLSCKPCFPPLWTGYAAPKNFCGPASMPLTYHGERDVRYIHYLCKTQYIVIDLKRGLLINE